MYVQILGEGIGGSVLAGRGYVLSMDLQPPTPNNKSVKLENCKRVLRLYLKQITSVYSTFWRDFIQLYPQNTNALHTPMVKILKFYSYTRDHAGPLFWFLLLEPLQFFLC